MKQWFAALEEREQRLIVAGGLILLPLMLYLLVTEPLHENFDRQQSRLASEQKLLHKMEQIAARAKLLKAQKSRPEKRPIKPGNLLAELERSLTSAGIDKALKRISPEKSNRARLQFDEVSFDALYRWIGTLEERYGLKVELASMSATKTAGMVEARLLIG